MIALSLIHSISRNQVDFATNKLFACCVSTLLRELSEYACARVGKSGLVVFLPLCIGMLIKVAFKQINHRVCS
jgi:hypothetical protein